MNDVPVSGKKKGSPKKEDRKHPHPGEFKARPKTLITDTKSHLFLRRYARMLYVTDPNHCSITDLAKLPEFATCSYAQMQKWADLDDWVAERKRNTQFHTDRLIMQLSNELIKEREKDLGSITSIADVMLKKILPEQHPYTETQIMVRGDLVRVCKVCGKPEAGCNDPFWGVSGDKLIGAFAKLVELKHSLADAQMKTILPLHAPQDGEKKHDGNAPPIEVALTDEEAREAAHAVLRKRRAALLAPKEPETIDVVGGDD